MKTVEIHEGRSAEDMTNAVGERAKDCVDVGVNTLNAVSSKARQLGANADGYVRENPWVVVGVAAGVGLLAGFLLRGRRES